MRAMAASMGCGPKAENGDVHSLLQKSNMKTRRHRNGGGADDVKVARSRGIATGGPARLRKSDDDDDDTEEDDEDDNTDDGSGEEIQEADDDEFVADEQDVNFVSKDSPSGDTWMNAMVRTTVLSGANPGGTVVRTPDTVMGQEFAVLRLENHEDPFPLYSSIFWQEFQNEVREAKRKSEINETVQGMSWSEYYMAANALLNENPNALLPDNPIPFPLEYTTAKDIHPFELSFCLPQDLASHTALSDHLMKHADLRLSISREAFDMRYGQSLHLLKGHYHFVSVGVVMTEYDTTGLDFPLAFRLETIRPNASKKVQSWTAPGALTSSGDIQGQDLTAWTRSTDKRTIYCCDPTVVCSKIFQKWKGVSISALNRELQHATAIRGDMAQIRMGDRNTKTLGSCFTHLVLSAGVELRQMLLQKGKPDQASKIKLVDTPNGPELNIPSELCHSLLQNIHAALKGYNECISVDGGFHVVITPGQSQRSWDKYHAWVREQQQTGGTHWDQLPLSLMVKLRLYLIPIHAHASDPAIRTELPVPLGQLPSVIADHFPSRREDQLAE